MKDPKTLFPFLFASSWVGNLFLTIIAFYLAFTHDGPLSPVLFLVIAICILSGNLLPILMYWLLVYWRQVELKAENAEVSVRVRDALRRSEDILGRLDEAEGSLSKAILVTRQVPERIRESFEGLTSLSERLDTLELTSFAESMSTQNESVGAVQKELESLGKQLKKLEGELQDVPKTLEAVLQESRERVANGKDEEADVATGERLDLVFESLETIQDSLDGLLERMASLKVTEQSQVGPEKPVDPEESEVESEEEPAVIDEDTGDGDRGKTAVAEEAGNKQGLLVMEEEQEQEVSNDAERSGLNHDQVRIVAHAMVGMSNKLFIRGDEPWLSWDQGVPMDLIGIGEFAWSSDEIREPLEVSIRLNDEVEASGGTISLIPGKITEISPVFTQS